MDSLMTVAADVGVGVDAGRGVAGTSVGAEVAVTVGVDAGGRLVVGVRVGSAVGVDVSTGVGVALGCGMMRICPTCSLFGFLRSFA